VIRYVAITAGAATMTLCCFAIMISLISGEVGALPASVEPRIALGMYEIERVEREPPVRERAVKMLPAVEPPIPEDGFSLDHDNLPVARETIAGSIADDIGFIDVPFEIEAPVANYVPTIIVQPVYPLVAEMKEIEGSVVVGFSVRANGTVRNPFVVDSTPGTVFDQAALAAISRFRFQPRRVGPDYVDVERAEMRFVFRLEDVPR